MIFDFGNQIARHEALLSVSILGQAREFRAETGERAHADHRDDADLVRSSATRASAADQCRDPVEAPVKARRPEHVIGEEQRQVEDHADHRRRDAGERRGELQVAVRGFDERCAGEDEDERGQEGEAA